jgi:hypothetical protein
MLKEDDGYSRRGNPRYTIQWMTLLCLTPILVGTGLSRLRPAKQPEESKEKTMDFRSRRLGIALAGTVLAATAVVAAAPSATADTDPYRVVIVSLRCLDTEDTFGADEAYIKVNDRTVWGPQSMNEDDALPINESVEFTTTAEIRLYDADTGIFDKDDFLGEVTASKDQVNQGEQKGTFKRDGAHYRMIYKVVPNQ